MIEYQHDGDREFVEQFEPDAQQPDVDRATCRIVGVFGIRRCLRFRQVRQEPRNIWDFTDKQFVEAVGVLVEKEFDEPRVQLSANPAARVVRALGAIEMLDGERLGTPKRNSCRIARLKNLFASRVRIGTHFDDSCDRFKSRFGCLRSAELQRDSIPHAFRGDQLDLLRRGEPSQRFAEEPGADPGRDGGSRACACALVFEHVTDEQPVQIIDAVDRRDMPRRQHDRFSTRFHRIASEFAREAGHQVRLARTGVAENRVDARSRATVAVQPDDVSQIRDLRIVDFRYIVRLALLFRTRCHDGVRERVRTVLEVTESDRCGVLQQDDVSCFDRWCRHNTSPYSR